MGKQIKWSSLYFTASLCFILSLLLSSLARMTFSEKQVSIAYIWQLASVSAMIACWQGIFTLPTIVKKTSYWFRLIGGLSTCLVSVCIMAYIYNWFPRQLSYWLIFILFFVVFAVITFFIVRLYSKRKAKEYTKQLEEFLKQNK